MAMSVNKPNLIYISPVVPDGAGNGVSMRAYNVLKALSSHYEIYLLVIDTFSRDQAPGKDVLEVCRRVARIPLAPGRDFRLAARMTASKSAPSLYARHSPHPMEWLYITPERLRSAGLVFGGTRFNVVHVFRLYMVPYALLYTQKNFSGVAQLDLDDIESLARRRLSELFALNGDSRMASCMRAEAEKYEAVERVSLPSFDRVFVCSDTDRDRLSRHYGRSRFEVIPNVVHIPGETMGSPDGTFHILFVGSLGYYPNSEGVIFFCERVLPLLRKKCNAAFSVDVVGDGISQKAARRLSLIPEVNLAGRVRDIGPYYRNAHLVIVPVRAGGGTRIKALEAFAYRRPVVSTSIGVEGIDAQHEKHLLIADTEDMFAGHCMRLMTDPELRRTLTDNAFHLVAESYNVELLKERFLSSY